ncbi:MAG TPA: bifunctional 5,10-methylenetetrahydrofolate dehydrogenase/5,10-methenyltetrahydrofolate cyclohydrolase [Solirubrobacterales bacterium]|nr:bifunctional 5,10-methylenetetrahydrofolate dehydrogenase/5,10-methenyltetrahydrofolate cyclohydrolase [Solirubrobacterales bacterium]
MTAEVLDGKAIAADLRRRVAGVVAARVAAGRRAPGLATVLVGDDPASHIYVGNKRKACEEAGIRSIHHELPGDVSGVDLVALVAGLDRDPEVDGILVQMPLPAHIDQDAVLAEISAGKDVDGLTAVNAGHLGQGRIGVREALDLEPDEPLVGLVPCTPAGVIEILDRSGVELEGAVSVVIGRSILVGRPMASLLVNASATVTVCHSRTRDLAAACREADVLIAAVGRPEMVRADWVKPGATVVDVGMNRTDAGLVGDVATAEVAEVAARITPVPGGVGPMTIAMLLANTVRASR